MDEFNPQAQSPALPQPEVPNSQETSQSPGNFLTVPGQSPHAPISRPSSRSSQREGKRAKQVKFLSADTSDEPLSSNKIGGEEEPSYVDVEALQVPVIGLRSQSSQSIEFHSPPPRPYSPGIATVLDKMPVTQVSISNILFPPMRYCNFKLWHVVAIQLRCTNGKLQYEIDQHIQSLQTHRVNTILELRRIEKIFADISGPSASEVTQPMTAACKFEFPLCLAILTVCGQGHIT
jgi:hypothetical protein